MNDRLWTVDQVSLAGSGLLRLNSITTVVRPGVTALIGGSGAGKTSLLNLLVRFERPDTGSVASHLDDQVRLPYFWGPQDDGLWPRTTVREHLQLVIPRHRQIDVQTLLADFDLLDLSECVPETISRGEASRLAVARGIATNAKVLVLDEPLSHVDPARRGRYWDRLTSHCRTENVSLVFASHEPADVMRYADHVIAMKSGQIVFDGDVRTLYHQPPSEFHAALLGPANWLGDDEWRVWDLTDRNAAACLRPEQISLEPVVQSPISVVHSRHVGSVTESDLRSDLNGETRRFLHRPSGATLERGTKVRLTLCMLLAAFVVAGCDSDSLGPEIEIGSERRFSLPVSAAELPAPRDITVGLRGEKIILDNAGRVLVYDDAGELVRQWDMPESSAGNPEGACVLEDGSIIVADTHYHRIVFFDPAGNVTGMLGELGKEPGQFIYPVAVTTDDSGNLYVAEYGGNDRIQKFDSRGKYLMEFGSFGEGTTQFQRPSGIAWLEGKLYVADAFNSRIHVFDDSGSKSELLDASDIQLHYPYDISLGPEGNLYIVEYGAGRVTVMTTKGELIGRFGTTGRGKHQFSTPWGLAVDSKRRVWVADTGNRRVVELLPLLDNAAPLPSPEEGS